MYIMYTPSSFNRGHRSRDETSSPPGYSFRFSDTEDVNDDDTDTDLVAKVKIMSHT